MSGEAQMRALREIIVHCSATRPGWMADAEPDAKVAEIRRWHTEERRWSDIGYHLVIDRDGTTLPARPMAKAGAHVSGRNADTIGVCLIGGHGSAASDAFSENFTERQDVALMAVIGTLRASFGRLALSGHNEHAAKACPGFRVPDWARARGIST